MQIGNNIQENYYSTPLPEERRDNNAPKPEEKVLVEAPRAEAKNGSRGLQKEVLGITSLNQTQISNRETAQKQLKNGYLDITI
ncbi:MAG: hypothetical protein R2863_06795 [Candidatus Kapaibacterium sp.]|nr:hypothetical protein [Ignavibacteriota bacterium]MCB9221640.1 hypothetical protein [Ignavibacteria bacterium]